MHDYHKAVDIVNYGTEQVKKEGKSKVTKVNLVIGEDSGYSGDSIKMYFEDVSVGTVCEGAEISVRPVKTKLKCPKCGELFEKKPLEYDCPKCGTPGEPTEIGREVDIESVEME